MRRIMVFVTALTLLVSSFFLQPLGAESGQWTGEETQRETAVEAADAEDAPGPEGEESLEGEEAVTWQTEDCADDTEEQDPAESTELRDRPDGPELPADPDGTAEEADDKKEAPGHEVRESEAAEDESGPDEPAEVPDDLEGSRSEIRDETSEQGVSEGEPQVLESPEEESPREPAKEDEEETKPPQKAPGGTRAVTYRVTVRFRANGGSIDTPAENDGTVYPIYRVASATDRVQVKRSRTGSWTNYTEVVTTDETYHNLINVGEMGLYRTGYHVVAGRAYNTRADASGLRISQVNTAVASTNPATAVRINGGEPVTEDKTVDLYVEWIADSCTIVLHSNGGSWYQPSQGEPAGALGTPAGSGTDRTYTKTLKAQDTVVLHNTFAQLLTDYYRDGSITAADLEIPEDTNSRWMTWFTREGYVFQGWNTQADANGSPTSRYPGRNVLEGGKMLNASGALTTAASNNFGRTTSLSMSGLGASDGDTIHLYAQWRKRVTAAAGDLTSGLRLSAEGFAHGSSLYDGLELMIPSQDRDTVNKVRAGGSSDFTWEIRDGIGRFWFRQALTRNTPYDSDSSLWVLLPDRAYDIHGVTYDVKVTLSNIRLMTAQNVGAGEANIFWVDMENGEVLCAVYPVHTGASYTVSIQVFESGTDREVTGLRSMMLLRDMDIPDRISGSANYQYRWNDGNSPTGDFTSANGRVPAVYPYAEAIRIPLSAIAAPYTKAAGKVLYAQEDNSLAISQIPEGVHVTGSEYTGIQSSELGQVLQRDTYKTCVAFPVITGDLELVWTGNACGTTLFEDGEMNRVTSLVVEGDGVTPVNGGAGSPEEGGTVTFGGQGPRAYPFNGSAAYVMTPAEEHKVFRVWLDPGTDHGTELILDGEEHTAEGIGTYRISEGGGSFTFVGIVADHEIRVAFVPSWPLTGALSVKKIVTGSLGSRAGAFHFILRLNHELGYDNYPAEGFPCRLNDGEEEIAAPVFDPEEPGCAVLSFTLTHGDVMTVGGLWEGTAYQVIEEEADQNGYATTLENGTGVIEAEQTAEALVINDRDMAVPTGAALPDALPALSGGLAGLLGLGLLKRRGRGKRGRQSLSGK